MFKSRKTPSRNAPMQATEFLAKMSNSDISPVTNVVSLETLYKSDSNTAVLPAVLKIIGKTHKKYLRWKQFSVYFHGGYIGNFKLPRRNSAKDVLLGFS